MDLALAAFLQLRRNFFDAKCAPNAFPLREKRNTQDDPFDEYLAKKVLSGIADVACEPAPGPLITPDIVLYAPAQIKKARASNLKSSNEEILAIEVKKLKRTKSGGVARASGLDFNTTPPCGLVRIYGADGNAIVVRGFYLFVCLESAPSGNGEFIVSALSLVDGNLLNEDFDFYLSIVGRRKKEIGLGTFGDGANRNRPMVIFANPLGADELDKKVTLIHPSEQLSQDFPELEIPYVIQRTTEQSEVREFFCYVREGDPGSGQERQNLLDPFPTPSREVKTAARGKFTLPFSISD